jgi:hypothetical protein
MMTILSALVSILAFRVRSHASLELELISLRHQVSILRRRHKGRIRLFSTDRLLWVWLYRIWPQVLNAMVLVKPATVVQWHRKGFRLYWRWRSRRLGRPKMGTEIRDLIRRMSVASRLWGAPRIHGELLKLGIQLSQATVGRYLPWRPKIPSSTWRSFRHNHLTEIAAIDMFVVATATFRLLSASQALEEDADVTDRNVLKIRILLGCLFGVLLGLPFSNRGLTELNKFMFSESNTGAFDPSGFAFIVVPFMLGFSTNLVLAILDRSISTIRTFFGFSGGK